MVSGQREAAVLVTEGSASQLGGSKERHWRADQPALCSSATGPPPHLRVGCVHPKQVLHVEERYKDVIHHVPARRGRHGAGWRGTGGRQASGRRGSWVRFSFLRPPTQSAHPRSKKLNPLHTKKCTPAASAPKVGGERHRNRGQQRLRHRRPRHRLARLPRREGSAHHGGRPGRRRLGVDARVPQVHRVRREGAQRAGAGLVVRHRNVCRRSAGGVQAARCGLRACRDARGVPAARSGGSSSRAHREACARPPISRCPAC